jgi:hypothetical protein
MVAFFYKLRANLEGWHLLGEQDGNTYYFSTPLQRRGGGWPCFTSNELKITLRPASWGGTRVSMMVTGEHLALCADPSP